MKSTLLDQTLSDHFVTILSYLSKIVLTEIEVQPFMEHLVRSKVDEELKIYRKGVTWHNVDPKMMAGPARHHLVIM